MSNSKVVSTETGNNELQLVEFKIGDSHFGINIEKASKIINYMEPTKYPKSQKEILGILNYMGETIPVISLFESLELKPKTDKKMIIVAHFNNKTIAFVIEEIVGILRSTWENLESTQEIMSNLDSENSLVTSVLKYEKRLISMVDFENVFSKVSNIEKDLDIEDVKSIKSEKEIIFAEDSRRQ
jgi:two-component system chemotaxis response regulator CheV